MPVTIACPKCQTKYKLPESALGKSLKCQKCGAGFKTNPPAQNQAKTQQAKQPLSSAPAAPAAPAADTRQQRAQEMRQLGIDGPLVRQGDIFGAALPQGAGQLGNYAGEDPGFDGGHVSNVEVEHVAEQPSPDQGMQAILDNPLVSSSAAGAGIRGRVKKTSTSSSYLVPKIGMWAVFVATLILLVIAVIITVVVGLRRISPDSLRWIGNLLGRELLHSILSYAFFAFVILVPTAVLTFFIGQICCIFSPNKNEKIFAGSAVGAIGLAILIFLGLCLFGVFGSFGSDAGQAAQIAGGLFILASMFFNCVLVLTNWFLFIGYFKRVGKNIKSRKVREASTTATLACLGAFALFFISSFIGSILFRVLPDNKETVSNVFAFFNAFVGFGVSAAILVMIKTTLNVLKKKNL